MRNAVGFVHVNGSSLYYELIDGKPDQPYLVFLHEGLGCVKMWKTFPRDLCRLTGCPGLLYDRNGYGRSDPLKSKRKLGYVHDYALVELPELLNLLIPDKPHILIGHSDGGSIALIYGAKGSHLLRAMVTEAPHVFVEPLSVKGIRAADEAFERGEFNRLKKYHGDKTTIIFKAWTETWLSEDFRKWNIEALLPQITVPLLVIQGRDDQYGTEAQVTAVTSQTSGPAEHLLVEACGHTPHREKPEVTTARIAQFIDTRCS